ncbi:PAS domain S-box protein [Agarivorans sp. TSD2052]|uniref:PAS domain S-box protein n=1 Tax=Agarivorans sp. TSD2052 TaxID=2937286 RepID=UPI0020109AEF|nr:PAS domain S-box protein [Agarivorans sp. TSD2052]UPW19045.1 PAS domain S-box protein [Agarivorans sp. TSD2052]
MNNSNLSSQQYFRILDSLPEHVFIFSEQGEYLSVFGGQENKVGSDCKEYIGRTLFDVMPADMASQFHQFITKTLDSNQSQTVKYHFNSQHLQDLPFGSEQHQDLWIEGIIKPFVMDDGKRVVIWTARNVTDKHYMEIKLKELSETDALTGDLKSSCFYGATVLIA